ncbi:hypothetical protein ASG63_08395 [Methylobacterium sp. Leaf94]|nr:hypothetical protein ASG63_08395 [Methylobacterium sp. Leaf94]
MIACNEAELIAPAATFVTTCAAPGLAPVPPRAVMATVFAVDVRWTTPMVPLEIAFEFAVTC